MRLSPTRFDTFLNKIGQSYDWRKAYACPCRNPNSGSTRHNCLQCAGKGFLYAEPVSGNAGTAGAKVQREWAAFGAWQSGDIVLTIPSDSPIYDIGERDRVTHKNNSEPFSDIFTHGEHDTLRFPLMAIDRIFWLDDAQQIVDGGIPQLSATNTMSWTTGGPPTGKQYTVTGRYHPEYFMLQEFPSDRAHQFGDPLPRRVVLRRYDLAGR